MPIPKPVLYPPFDTLRISHIEYGVKNLDASKKFYSEILGLQITDEDEKIVYLRAMEERGHHSVMLRESENADVKVLGFKVFSEKDLDRAEIYFISKGCKTSWIKRPYQGRTLLTSDNNGIPIEFYYKMDRLETIHQQYNLYKGVKPLRIDHFNCFSPNVDRSLNFYNDFGFRVTEYTEDDESGSVWAAWLHRKGGVHDIAFTNGTGPRMHHVGFWVPTPLNIIDLLDLMASTGYVDNIERGPGRHGISNAFFLYIFDPDGHRIEIYCSDYQTIDPDHEAIRWSLTDPQRQTLWGAPAPRKKKKKGSHFEGISVRSADLKAQPIIAPDH